MYNYADDNTLSFCSPDYDVLISTLESEYVQFTHWFKVNKQTKVLAVGKKTYNKILCIHIQNSDLSCESTVKLLGIDIDYHLNIIGNICSKASQQLNILKYLRSYLNKLSNLTIFHTLILSNFNFCPLAWISAQRTIFKNLKRCRKEHKDHSCSYEQFLDKDNMPSLHIRSQRTMAIETFKVINKIDPVCLRDYLHTKNPKNTFRSSNILEIS